MKWGYLQIITECIDSAESILIQLGVHKISNSVRNAPIW